MINPYSMETTPGDFCLLRLLVSLNQLNTSSGIRGGVRLNAIIKHYVG